MPADDVPARGTAADAGEDTGPDISVLIPCWNAGPGIERAIGSVLASTDVSLECVVIDDGSTDDTAEIVAEIAERDPRVVLLRSPANEGVSAARNRGLGAARGTWLAFLDADDRLMPGGLEAMARATRTGEPRVVIGQRIWSDGERTWVTPFYDIPDIRTPGRKSIATHPGLLYYASATGRLIHRSCVEGLEFEGRVLGDQPWTIRAMLRAGDRIEVIGDTVYEWWRPKAGEFLPTITVGARFSARRAAVAARVAAVAWAQVVAEAERTVHDPAGRERVAATYLERLVRADLGVYLGSAVERRDPELPELLDAIDDFLRSTPPSLVGTCRAVAVSLLHPPLRAWPRLPRKARPAFLRMAGSAVEANRSSGGPGTRLEWLPGYLAVAPIGPLGPAAAFAGSVLAAALRRLVRRFRRRS
jgi:glycosyltransferase involved in cell wall biosynthesis